MSKKTINDQHLEPWLRTIKSKSERSADLLALKAKKNGDIDAVWTNISTSISEQQLTKKVRLHLWHKSIIGTAAIILILIGIGFTYYHLHLTIDNDSGAILPQPSHKVVVQHHALPFSSKDKNIATSKQEIEKRINHKHKTLQRNQTDVAILNGDKLYQCILEQISNNNQRLSKTIYTLKNDGVLDTGSLHKKYLKNPVYTSREQPSYWTNQHQKDRVDHKKNHGVNNNHEVTVKEYNKYKNRSYNDYPNQEQNHTILNRISYALSMTSSSSVTFKQNQGNNVLQLMGTRKPILEKELNFSHLETDPFLYDKAKFKHSLPLVLNLNIAIQPFHRIVFDTGIHYILLRSRIEGYTPDVIEQKVHYIGFPITASFILFEKRGISLYTGIGGEINKAIISSLGKKELGIKPWQFATSAHIGIAYQVAPLVQLYISPSISYYFDDGTRLQTYYKEHPLNFSLSLGIRITPNFW